MKGAPLLPVAPWGCPRGIDPSAWRKALADRIEQLRDAEAALIDALDSMEPDLDLEPNLGALTSSHAESQLDWGWSSACDLEGTNEDGGDILDAPHYFEPSLGWTASVDQSSLAGAGDDREVDAPARIEVHA